MLCPILTPPLFQPTILYDLITQLIGNITVFRMSPDTQGLVDIYTFFNRPNTKVYRAQHEAIFLLQPERLTEPRAKITEPLLESKSNKKYY